MSSDWVVVLVKDFGDAKQRLEPALNPEQRRELARRNAERAIRAAALATPDRLVVAGSDEVAEVALQLGVEVLVEPRQEGQNPAAQRGIQASLARGAGGVLLMSSDLPLVEADDVRALLDAAASTSGPVAIAAPATGRGGTNALYLRPPSVIGLHFGGDSLALFRRDAELRGVPFLLHESAAFALDLDEPADLARLRRAV
jgi:2-phospho-L-lactate guanylyltransferase